MNEFPIVKITLQGMEHSICHAMSNHLAQMDTQCQEAVKRAVENFDYAGEVSRMATAMVRDGIKRALEKEIGYGASYEAVQRVAGAMIRESLDRIAGEFAADGTKEDK